MEKMTALSGDGGEQRRVHQLLPSQRENVCPSLPEDVKNKQRNCLPASDCNPISRVREDTNTKKEPDEIVAITTAMSCKHDVEVKGKDNKTKRSKKQSKTDKKRKRQDKSEDGKSNLKAGSV
ncbi:hypothetical protein Tco_1065110 [Tanacetum coccineum]